MRHTALPVLAATLLALAGCTTTSNQSDAKPSASATTSEAAPSPSTSVSPECRAWIMQELKDDTDSIDAVSGQQACGDLSEDELNKAIEQVTKDIEADPSALEEATSTQAEQFQKCAAEKGTAGEKTAVKHVVKVTGADEHNGIADTADVFTNYTGGLIGPHAGDGKLIASAFASCYSSKNGLVTVYDKAGDVLANGNY